MYYVCKVHKNGEKLVAVEVCDTDDGIVDYIPINELHKYKDFNIDGINGTKVKVSKHALGDDYFKKEVLKQKLANTLASKLLEDEDVNEKIYFSVGYVKYNAGEDTDEIMYNDTEWCELAFEFGILANFDSDNSVKLTVNPYLYDEEEETTFELEDFKVLDVSSESVKAFYSGFFDDVELYRAIKGYFRDLRGLFKASGADFEISDRILNKKFSDKDIEIESDNMSEYYYV